jgi:hypothetical protein
MANGLYDFILAHYNPAADNTNNANPALKACIDAMAFSYDGGNHYTFDGLAAKLAGTPARVVPGINGGSPLTNAARTANGTINDNFQGNITTSMARYLKNKLGITEFKNANIYGDYNQWGSQYVNHETPNFTNVGLVGNYSGSNAVIHAVIKGVLDIQGPIAGASIINANGTKTGYLKLSGDVGSTNNRYSNFAVVDVTGVTITNISKVGNGNINSNDKANVIIFASKTQANTISISSENTPTYRAFENGSGTRNYAPSSFGGNIGSPTNPSGQVPALSEQEWETAAPAAPPTINANGNTWTTIGDLVE